MSHLEIKKKENKFRGGKTMEGMRAVLWDFKQMFCALLISSENDSGLKNIRKIKNNNTIKEKWHKSMLMF